MKKILISIFMLLFYVPLVSAYTHTVTDETGKIIMDKNCVADSNYFKCTDKVNGSVSTTPRYQRQVQDVYVNGQYKRVVKEQYGDKVFINY